MNEPEFSSASGQPDHKLPDSSTTDTNDSQVLSETVGYGHNPGPAIDGTTAKLESTSLTGGQGAGLSLLKELPASPPAPPAPSSAEKPYDDPTPRTPNLSRRPSAHVDEKEYDEKDELRAQEVHTPQPKEKEKDDAESVAEIQSIMEQFENDLIAPTRDSIMSPTREKEDPIAAAGKGFPPRRSSLEPLRSRDMDAIASSPIQTHHDKHVNFPSSPPPVPPKPETATVPAIEIEKSTEDLASISSHQSSAPPPPEPEPPLPFDFHRFLEQLRHKSADPVAKFLRSFLNEFGRKQWLVHEQVKIIGDFLAFITVKMGQCEVWRDVSENEFDNAKEGMEKLVMNRLYSQTFSPAIPAPLKPHSKNNSKQSGKLLGTGRRGQHQEDVERDEILAQKIRIYSWVREQHLDIPPVGPNGERFLRLAQQELLKIKSYRAPRDKVVCMLNCCKVIFGLLKNASTSGSSDTSADSFVPLLIYVVLQANPDHLVSNVQYILRFRNSDKLSGEAGYYLSSLSGAIHFVENLDRTTLTVSDDEFERHVEEAVAAIAAENHDSVVSSPTIPHMQFSEKNAPFDSEARARGSMDMDRTGGIDTPKRSQSRSGPSSSGGGADSSEDGVSSLLKTIRQPLSSIGRIFSDNDASQTQQQSSSSASVPTRKLSPSVFQPPGADVEGDNDAEKRRVQSYDAQEAAARQASAEAAQARKIQRAEHKTIVDTLAGMFPNLDREVIDDVVRQKQGRVGLAVDSCLSLTAGL